MSKIKTVTKYGLYVVIAAGSFWAGQSDYVYKNETTDKTRHKETRTIKERIVERANGDKVTERTIKEKTDDKRKVKVVQTVKSKQHMIGLSVSRSNYFRGQDTFTLSIHKKILSNVLVGVSADDRGSIGISLLYAF